MLRRIAHDRSAVPPHASAPARHSASARPLRSHPQGAARGRGPGGAQYTIRLVSGRSASLVHYRDRNRRRVRGDGVCAATSGAGKSIARCNGGRRPVCIWGAFRGCQHSTHGLDSELDRDVGGIGHPCVRGWCCLRGSRGAVWRGVLALGPEFSQSVLTPIERRLTSA